MICKFVILDIFRPSKVSDGNAAVKLNLKN